MALQNWTIVHTFLTGYDLRRERGTEVKTWLPCVWDVYFIEQISVGMILQSSLRVSWQI